MIYRGAGFLAVVCFGSSPTPSPVSKLSLFLKYSCVSPVELIPTRERKGWKGVDEVLYKSFNTLWEQPNNTLVESIS